MEIAIPVEDPARRGVLYGPTDRNLRLIRSAFNVRISARENIIRISGTSEDVHRAAQAVEVLQRSLRDQADLAEEQVHEAIEQASRDGSSSGERPIEVFLSPASIAPKGREEPEFDPGRGRCPYCVLRGSWSAASAMQDRS